MKRAVAAFLFATASVCLAPTAALAQAEAPAIVEDFKPSSLNQPGQEYPQVNSQGYVRFRIEAPEAQGPAATAPEAPSNALETAPPTKARPAAS